MNLDKEKIWLEVTSDKEYYLIAEPDAIDNYKVTGYHTIPRHLDADGLWQIQLFVESNLGASTSGTSEAIKQSIKLGEIPDGELKVDIKINIIEGPHIETTTPKGTTTISSSTATEKDRPFTFKNYMKSKND